MKRYLALILAIALIAVVAAGCGGDAGGSGSGSGGGEGASGQSGGEAGQAAENGGTVKVRAASLNKEIALPLYYIHEMGWDLENGFEIELSAYDGGALVNEALGAGLWDVAALGAASVMSMAKYDCVQIFAHQDVGAGIDAIVRADSEILSVKGHNPDYPEVYGSPETVGGKTILVTIGSGNHMQISKWLQIIGLTDSDVNMVHMEFAQAWQAFSSGEADVFSSTYPYTAYAYEEGYVAASTFDTIGVDYANNVICTRDFYENNRDTLVALVGQIIRANDDLSDLDTATEWMVKWYQLNGNEVGEEDARTQMEVNPFFDSAVVSSPDFNAGDVILVQAEFFYSIENINEAELEQVKNNIKTDVLEEALAGL